ncbi:unnamed protein product, partial [Ilex paraguariensis]
MSLYNAKTELATYIGPSAMFPILQYQGFVQQHPDNPSSSVMPYNVQSVLGLHSGPSLSTQLMIGEPQQQQQHHYDQQVLDAQQLAAVEAARQQQEMLRAYEQQRYQQQAQQLDPMRSNIGFDSAGAGPSTATGFNIGFDSAGAGPSTATGFNIGFDTAGAGPSTATGFNQMTEAALSTSLALGSYGNPYQIQEQPEEQSHSQQLQVELHPQFLLQQEQLQHQQLHPQPEQPPAPQKQETTGTDERRSNI